MTQIPASLVKELREETGLGMMECKRALTETNGDKAAAIKILRERGVAVAAKKADRAAKQGIIAASICPEGKGGTMIEVNCETDFVSSNDNFKAFVTELLEDAKTIDADNFTEATKAKVDAKVIEIGENIIARRCAKYTLQGTGCVAAYVHLGGKFGVMIEVGCQKDDTVGSDAFKALVADLTLHITAAAPAYLKREDVPADVVAMEKDIYTKQVEGKPENIVEKIVLGKLDKYFSQVCLLEQAFVKDQDKTIGALLAEAGKALDDQLEIRRFVRWQLGA